MTRGVRLHNPGNLKHGEDWDYLAAVQDDRNFCVFEHYIFGLRALAKLLLNYQKNYNLHTIEAIINRFAPPVENNTSAYVDFVCRETGFKKDANIILNRSNCVSIMRAIIQFENGVQPYSWRDFKYAYTLAVNT